MRLLIFNLKTDADDAVLGFTTDWINALAARVERIHVVTMAAGRLAVAPNVEVFSLGKERGYSEPRRAWRFYAHLFFLLRHGRVDACFTHMNYRFAVLAAPLLKAWGVPSVLWYAHKHVPGLLKVAERLVDRVVTSSRSGFQLDSPKVRVIGQGIDTARFVPAGAGPRPFTFLSVGRLSPIKRVELLIHALGLLAGRRPEVPFRAVIVGGPLSPVDEAYEAGLKALVLQLGLGERITFEGHRSFQAILPYYQGADCFVNPSDTDSVDKTVLEAMSCSLPVVTSNIAFQEILGPELAAAWVIPKDDPESLCVHLCRLLDMPAEAREALGVGLRRIVVEAHGLPALSEKILAELAALKEKP